MSNPTGRWAFVVPGEDIAFRNPALIKLLEDTGKTWEDFIYLSTAEVLGYLNRHGLEDFQEGVNFLVQEAARQTPYQSHNFNSGQIDEIVTSVMAGFDLVDSEVVDDDSLGGISEMLSEKQYAILYPAVIHVLQTLVRYVTAMFEEPRERHGIPYEISLDRLIGRDLVFTIAYLNSPNSTL